VRHKPAGVLIRIRTVVYRTVTNIK